MASELVEYLLPRTPSFLAAALFLALAAWLVSLDARSRVNWGFSIVLLTRAVFYVATSLTGAPDEDLARLAARAAGAQVPVALAGLVAFGCLYPQARTWFGRSRSGLPLLAATGLAVAALILAQPGLYAAWSYEPGVGVRSERLGPLFVLIGPQVLVSAIVSLLLARHYVRMPPGPQRVSVLLVVVAFALPLLNAATTFLIDPWRLLGPVEYGVYGWGTWSIFMLALPTLAWAAWVLARHRRTSAQAATRRHIRRALLVLVLPVLTGLITGLFAPETPFTPTTVVGGFWRLTGPLILAYALIKHQLFDIDLRIKWGIRRGTLAAVFVGVFFVATAVAQNLSSERFGLVFGGVVTGLLLFAIHPLQRISERVANVAMPGVQDTPAWRTTQKTDMYRAAVTMALSDGQIDEHDERTLARLADELGIKHADALELRQAVAVQLAGSAGASRRRPGKGRGA